MEIQHSNIGEGGEPIHTWNELQVLVEFRDCQGEGELIVVDWFYPVALLKLAYINSIDEEAEVD